MAVTTTVHATLIADVANSGGGTAPNADVTHEIASGSNSVHEIDGVFYVLVITGNDYSGTPTFQMYKSEDQGATWASVGSETTPSQYGGGMNSFVVGTQIRFAYSWGFHDFVSNVNLFVNHFETAGGTWGTEDSFDCGGGEAVNGSSTRVEGPYASFVRPDDSIVYLISDTLSAAHYAVVYDGTFHGPFLLTPSYPQLFSTAIMAADGTVHVFFGNGYDPSTLYHQTFSTLNAAGTPSEITLGEGQILSWEDMGLMHGFLDAGSFYLAAGRKNATTGVYGRPAILYGNDGAWTLGAEIDTEFSTYSVLTCALFLVNGQLIYYWRGISTDGSQYIDRVGYAPAGSHDTPGDWTWETIYVIDDPDPLVGSFAGPYNVPGPRGATTGLIRTGDEVRGVVTLKRYDADVDALKLFVAYLFSVNAGGEVVEFPNEFS